MVIANPAAEARFDPDKMGKATLARCRNLYAGLNCFEPGQEHKSHVHQDQDKFYYVISGTGEATIGDAAFPVSAGAFVAAPEGVPHGIRNTGDGRLIVMVVMGPPPPGK
ncbi:MAG: cupin domain-containing protein [Bryobacterales bacterium]|nr:cupin domain-containing protein [Bryobacterales bacterium]